MTLAPPLPSYAQIEPVGQCNLRCQMCPIQFREDGPPYGPPAFMPFATYTRLVDELPSLRRLHLQGLGEPMMHPQFFEMVRYADARGIGVTTNSNLTLLNERRAAECVACGLRELHVSVDGAAAGTYERIRVRGHFDGVVRNVRLLEEAKRRAGSREPALQIVMVLMRQNLDELPELIRLAASWGAGALFVQHLCHDFAESSLPAKYRPMREFVDAQTLTGEDPARIDRVFDEARCAARESGIDLRLPQAMPRGFGDLASRGSCDWPSTGMYFSYDGRAMPCCMVATPDRANFGGIEGRTVTEVWDSAAYVQFRDALASDNPPEICRGCAVYNGVF